MPLTSKGAEIKRALTKEYGAKKGEQVLYAGKNKGTFTGIDKRRGVDCNDALNRAIAAGEREAAAQKQAQRAMSGDHISGRDMGKFKRDMARPRQGGGK